MILIYLGIMMVLGGVHLFQKKRVEWVMEEQGIIATRVEELRKLQPAKIEETAATEDSDFTKLLNNYINWTRYINVIVEKKLGNMWLREIQGDALLRQMTIKGSTNSFRSVLVFRDVLVDKTGCRDVKMASMEVKTSTANALTEFDFSIECKI